MVRFAAKNRQIYLVRIIYLYDPVSCASHLLALAHPSTACFLEGGLQSQCVGIPFAFERASS